MKNTIMTTATIAKKLVGFDQLRLARAAQALIARRDRPSLNGVTGNPVITAWANRVWQEIAMPEGEGIAQVILRHVEAGEYSLESLLGTALRRCPEGGSCSHGQKCPGYLPGSSGCAYNETW